MAYGSWQLKNHERSYPMHDMELAACKTQENSNFLKKGKMVILVKILKFSRSRMTKQTSPLESFRKI